MTGEPWLYAALVALALGHLLAAWYGARASRRRVLPAADARTTDAPGSADGERPGPDDDADLDPAEAVECPHCGATNERGYHRCRHCVAQLPGGDGRALTRRPVRGDVFP